MKTRTRSRLSNIVRAASLKAALVALLAVPATCVAQPVPVITSTLTATGTQNAPFTYQIAATNNPTSYAVDYLPSSFTLDTATGIFTGTPAIARAYTITLSASNAAGVGTATLDLTITGTLAAPIAEPATFVTATTFTANWLPVPGATGYAIQISSFPFTFDSPFGSPGLVIGVSGGYTVYTTGTAVFVGKPNYPGAIPFPEVPDLLHLGIWISGGPSALYPDATYYYRVRALNDTGVSPYSNTIAVTTASVPATPIITSPSTYSAIAGAPFTYQITANNIISVNAPATYAATGLPAGLTIDPNTGLIIGTPTAPAGTYTVTITASNPTGSTTQQLTITLITDNILAYEPNTALVTLAGAAGLTGSTNATGTAARFNAPAGAVTDLAGNLYIADTANNAIRRIAPNGQVTTLPINGLSFPTALATTPDTTTLYIADTGNNAIRTHNLATNQTTTLAITDLDTPTALAVDPDGNLYIANTGAHTILRIAADTGAQYTIAGAHGVPGSADTARMTLLGTASRFNLPQGLAISPDGTFLYIADTGNSTIRTLRLTSPQNTYPTYPTDPVFDGIYRLTITLSNLSRNLVGKTTTLAGAPQQPGAIDGSASNSYDDTTTRLNTPQALAIDSTGNLYIADTGNHLIRKITVPDGNVTTLAGASGTAGTADGIGSQSRLNHPAAIATDSVTGDIYIADTANHTIRVLQTRPAILAQTPSQTVDAGAPASFSAVMSGAPAPRYQWYHGTKPIVGATTAIHTISAASAADAGSYTLTGTNIMGTVTTPPITLTVTATTSTTPPPSSSGNDTSGGGGGGGALSCWYLVALVAVALVHRGRGK